MFENLPASKPDAILALMTAFRADPRPTKADLGVGIYKDDNGVTPVMRSVAKAEQQLLDSQTTKSYVSPIGSADFGQNMIKLVFGENADTDRLRAAQAPGGSGALRILSELLHQTRPDARLWLSDPTWPNHFMLLAAAGFELQTYPYYDAERSAVDFDAMISALRGASEGDVVLLHGCCHNPTGADLSLDQWQQVADLCLEKSLFPFVDLAYQGFGQGLEADAAGLRLLASKVPEVVVAASCSKNFGLYRERVGVALLQAGTKDNATAALDNLTTVVRANYSMPPDHGASATHLILSQEELRSDWENELEGMRVRMVQLRSDFAAALRQRSNSDRFDYIASQHGMFSRLPLTSAQIDQLREQHGIYLVGDGRINVAGLPRDGLDALAEAIIGVMD